MARRHIALLVVVAAMCALPGGALAHPAAGVLTGDADVLVTFDTAAPASKSVKLLTGLGAGQHIMGLDFRYFPGPPGGPPSAPPRLFGLAVQGTTNAQLYTIDPGTGAATPASNVFAIPATTAAGFDFNPTVDVIRIHNSGDANLRFNLTAGTLFTDTNINPAGQQLSAAAYDRVGTPFAGPTSTTQYALNPSTDMLVTQAA